ncbi:peptidoglycan DD-metalloendopeptidase family protein [Catellatospora sp. NPDC049111]|uniref:M23 family metallopeptidase n=1 Tax=Catellatospora sp. NPDC049111 TaxID=3155271 RepID=UPI0033C62F57
MRLHLVAAGLATALTLAACSGPVSGPAFVPAAAPSTVPSTAPATSPTPFPAASPSTAPVRHVFPVLGKSSYGRTHHDYQATDVMAPCGATVVAVIDGVVLEISPVDLYDPKTDDGALRGGKSVSLLGDDGVRYYGSHFSAIDAKIKAGVRVKAGQPLGKVGRTGLASACHLHFGMSPACANTGDWWIRRGVIWPWRYLDAWRKGTAKSPVTEIQAWERKNGCSTKPPKGA